ncbi:hypothetical protein CLHUN_11300 [Ruminiclostridium hungatei]|uniref:Uncharacterized protein n=1 Tax=Ruminiclostridium hungatei TaxID=48256 RepID=A0A1V4SN63_RUMHU|nr:hypothetical protein [Ruminiclostridium hungatei]OPX45243.1 hypothetical protein CLHUN_11300 [Ruminiclostridium hungatei]
MKIKYQKTILLIVLGVFILAAGIFVLSGIISPVGSGSLAAGKETAAEGTDRLMEELKLAAGRESKISVLYTDDFDKNLKREVFALVEPQGENGEAYFNGQVWYADESTVKMLLEAGADVDSAEIWDVGSQKLFHVEEGYGGSGSISHVWSVKEGKPYEIEYAGESLQYAGEKQFITCPGSFDLLRDGSGGHTWKPYYLYFDEASGTLKEYGGIKISLEQLLELKGTPEIVKKLEDRGGKITGIFYRSNGIININYVEGAYNLNITLLVKDGGVTTEAGSIDKPDYDRGGIYKAAAFEAIAAYPEKFGY